MLTKVEVSAVGGAVLSLPLDSISNGLLVKEVEGLDPVKATIVTSSVPSRDGEQYQTSKRGKRNIIVKLKYKPGYYTGTVREIRKRVYGFFMPKTPVSMKFFVEDEPVYYINGYVEDCATPLFSEEPGVDISIICDDPDFFDPTINVFSGVTVPTATDSVLNYAGSVEVGGLFRMIVDRALPYFTIFHRPPIGTIRTLDFGVPLAAGDILEISSIPGAKGAVLTRGGTEYSVLYGISAQSAWLELHPGINNIRVQAEGAAVPYSIEYINKYGGL